jgi:hypothetical protein
MPLDLVRATAELGRVAGRESAERVVADLAVAQDLLDARHVGSTQQPVDPQLHRDLGGVERFGRAGAHHFHVGGRAGIADAFGQGRQGLLVDPHVLEADVAELQRQDQVEDRQAIGDGPILPGEHENEIHWASTTSPMSCRSRQNCNKLQSVPPRY